MSIPYGVYVRMCELIHTYVMIPCMYMHGKTMQIFVANLHGKFLTL